MPYETVVSKLPVTPPRSNSNACAAGAENRAIVTAAASGARASSPRRGFLEVIAEDPRSGQNGRKDKARRTGRGGGGRWKMWIAPRRGHRSPSPASTLYSNPILRVRYA